MSHLCGVFQPSALATLEVGTSLSSGAELTPPLSSKDKTTTQSVYELCFYIHRSAPRGVQNGLERFWWVQDGSYCVRTLLIGSERFLQDVGHKNKTSKKREKQMHKDPMDGASTLWRFPKWKGSAWTTESALSWMWNTPGSLGTRSNSLVVFDLSFVLVEVECSYLHLSLVKLLLGFCET